MIGLYYSDTHLAQSVLTSSLGLPMGLSGRIGWVGGWDPVSLVMHPYARRKPEEKSKPFAVFCFANFTLGWLIACQLLDT